jgi:hypothetical protein
MGWVADDYMVEHLDLEELPGADEVPGHLDVRLGGLGFPAWMVVHEDNGGGTGDHGGPEHLAGMDQDRIHGSDRGQVVAPDSAPGIQVQDDEAFRVRVVVGGMDDMCSPVIGGSVRRIAHKHVLWQRTFPQGYDPPLGRVPVSRSGRLKLFEELWLIHDTPSAVHPRKRGAIGVGYSLPEAWTAVLSAGIVLR